MASYVARAVDAAGLSIGMGPTHSRTTVFNILPSDRADTQLFIELSRAALKQMGIAARRSVH